MSGNLAEQSAARLEAIENTYLAQHAIFDSDAEWVLRRLAWNEENQQSLAQCLDEEMSRAEAAEAEAERLRGVLEGIASRACGIPGYAVAVGCGCPEWARAALAERRDP